MTGDVRLRLSCALLFACLPLMSVQLGGLGQPAFAPNLHTGAAGAAGAAAARPPVAPRPHSRRPRPFRTRPRPFAPTDGFLAAPVPGPKSETKSRYRYKQRKKNPNTHLHSSFSTTTPCFFVEQFPSHHRPCILFHNGADTTSCADTLVRTAPPLYLAIPATSNNCAISLFRTVNASIDSPLRYLAKPGESSPCYHPSALLALLVPNGVQRPVVNDREMQFTNEFRGQLNEVPSGCACRPQTLD
ncbi:hypothetical protein CCM_05901 [Cordyceps militaris CM01]|uniref:Uncharacterized protein n=1 Tax=Cordyceps militaris (strain CM01) TaxID=983644 RepID=G3JHN7_CORMM|nr:uncharacterized protein CCM_05901 [Cordyceps militaris CM01]EGX91743.1 hypothetical protein CCM_05901 [Cordyceps militaris CM01]